MNDPDPHQEPATFDRSAADSLAAGQVGLFGVPFDDNSSHAKGAALAPSEIRRQLFSPATNLSTERGLDLEHEEGWRDLGDLELSVGDWLSAIETTASHIHEAGAIPVALGGDHSIAYPLVRAAARYHSELTVLQFDAHPDLYDELGSNRYSHACPFARILEEGIVHRLVQVGVRTFNEHQREQAERFEVEVLEMADFRDGGSFTLDAPLYVSLDLDVLDPAFAPGVSHQEPGGMATRDLMDLIHDLPGPIVGVDLVELNPTLDIQHQTARVAARLLKELVAQAILEQ